MRVGRVGVLPGAGLVLVLGIVLAGVAPVASARAAAAPDPELVRACRDAVYSADTMGSTREQLLAGRVAILGRTAAVDLGGLDAITGPFTDSPRTLWWRSLAWLVPAFWPDVTATPVLGSADPVGDVVAALAADPDPGSGTPAALAAAVAAGWDEGTNLRREQTLNCLYGVTRDVRLLPALQAAAAANSDPLRYYGPPRHAVHNHGTMANLALLETARLLGDPALSRLAVARLKVEVDHVFTPAGFTFEQSSTYLRFNRALWTSVNEQVGAEALGASAPWLSATLARAASVEAHLTSPSGVGVAIGDGRPWTGPPPVAQRAQGVTDPVGGLVTGRWSWRDPLTSFWTLRFGAPAHAHGHDDHGSFTWQTLGVPVVVDPGSFTYDSRDPLATWQHSPQAHNVAVPTGASVRRAASTLLSRTRSGAIDRAVVRVGTFGVPLVRTIAVDDGHHRVSVVDVCARPMVAHLHLDPRWVPAGRSNRSLTFTSGARRLVLQVPAGVGLSVLRGTTRPWAGWVFPGYEMRVPAVEVLLSGAGRLAVTLRVS